MKFIMIVVMTSCAPKRALSNPGMPPQTAPVSMAARKHRGMSSTAGRFAQVMPTQAVTKEAM